MRAWSSKTIARVLVVPWSIARMLPLAMVFLPGAMIEGRTGLRQAAGEGTYVPFLAGAAVDG